jgi:hypothetical protein
VTPADWRPPSKPTRANPHPDRYPPYDFEEQLEDDARVAKAIFAAIGVAALVSIAYSLLPDWLP